LTRPAFGVKCACYNLYEVASLAAGEVGYVIRDYLKPTAARAFPNAPWAGGPKLFLNAALAPDVRYADRLRALLAEGRPFICSSGERVTAALLPSGREAPQDLSPSRVTEWLRDQGLPAREEPCFVTFDYPFHVIKHLTGLFPANIERRIATGDFRQVRPGVFVGEGVSLPDNAVFHAEEGPIVLDEGVRVLDFTYFSGPVYVGPHSKIIERSSVKEFTCTGRTVKIGGEVEGSAEFPAAGIGETPLVEERQERLPPLAASLKTTPAKRHPVHVHRA
jgi:glucose-1-phosphate thymidylyltransferase